MHICPLIQIHFLKLYFLYITVCAHIDAVYVYTHYINNIVQNHLKNNIENEYRKEAKLKPEFLSPLLRSIKKWRSHRITDTERI